MIVDYLSNAHNYYGLGPRIEAALRYLQDDDFDDLEEGSFVFDLEQEGLRAVRSNFESRPIEDPSTSSIGAPSTCSISSRARRCAAGRTSVS